MFNVAKNIIPENVKNKFVANEDIQGYETRNKKNFHCTCQPIFNHLELNLIKNFDKSQISHLRNHLQDTTPEEY